MRDLAQMACSAPWLDAGRSGEPLPRLRGANVRVRLGAARVALGDGRPTRRWTPPQAVATEDFLDQLTPMEALFYAYPPSPSAAAIRATIALGQRAARRLARSGRMPGWI